MKEGIKNSYLGKSGVVIDDIFNDTYGRTIG